jgi:hypothetical protein
MQKILLAIFLVCLTSIPTMGQGWKTFPKTDSRKNDTIGKEGILSDSVAFSNGYTPTSQVQGFLEISADPAIEMLDKKLAEADEKNPKIDGFTILIFSGSGANSRNSAKARQNEFSNDFPDYPTHLSWKNPSYEVCVGDFRTKLEAEKALQEIRVKYPSAFVRADKIELPLLEGDQPKETTP